MRPTLLLFFLWLVSLTNFAQENNSVYYTIDTLIISGNKITHPRIILRELTFKSGDSILRNNLDKELSESRANLLNASIFNFIELDTVVTESPGRIIIKINVVERWYIWPYPVFELADRNFNAWWRAKNLERVNYGTYINIENFRGRKELLRLMLKFGFDKKFSLLYDIPFINNAQTIGLSIEAGFTGNHEVALCTDSTNTVIFYKNEDLFQRRDWYGKLNINYRPAIHEIHSAGIFYQHTTTGDSLHILKPDFWPESKTISMIGIQYRFKADYRDYKHYPLRGKYYDFEGNLTHISEQNHLSYSLEANYRKFWDLNNGWYATAGLYGRISETPYLFNRGLGSDRYFVRAYEYYLIMGQQYFLSRFNLKYNFLPQTTYQIKPIKTPKFGLIHFASFINVFADAGYAGNRSKTLSGHLNNTLLASMGAGLDLITYYDKVLRLEYSINRLGEHGFFVHFMAVL